MISEELRDRLHAHGQAHVLEALASLDDKARGKLLRDMERIDLAELQALHADLGYRHLDNALGLREDLYHASASLHYTWHSTLRLVADHSGETRLEPGPPGWVRYSTLGMIWIFSPGFGLGCGVKVGHGEFAIERTYLCGLGARLNGGPPSPQ